MIDDVFTQGREQLGDVRYARAYSTGMNLCSRGLSRIIEDIEETPNFYIIHAGSVGLADGRYCSANEYDEVLERVDTYFHFCNDMLQDAIQKEDYYSAVAYKYARLFVRSAMIHLKATRNLQFPVPTYHEDSGD